MAVVARNGKPALTHYRTLRAWRTAVALLECRLATGRTHQIRVHLASRGNPVVGDPLYLRRVPAAARTLPEPVRHRLLDFPRQALHAARLGFAHPRTGQPLSFTTDPPADMAALIAALDRDLQASAGLIVRSDSLTGLIQSCMWDAPMRTGVLRRWGSSGNAAARMGRVSGT